MQNMVHQLVHHRNQHQPFQQVLHLHLQPVIHRLFEQQCLTTDYRQCAIVINCSQCSSIRPSCKTNSFIACSISCCLIWIFIQSAFGWPTTGSNIIWCVDCCHHHDISIILVSLRSCCRPKLSIAGIHVSDRHLFHVMLLHHIHPIQPQGHQLRLQMMTHLALVLVLNQRRNVVVNE